MYKKALAFSALITPLATALPAGAVTISDFNTQPPVSVADADSPNSNVFIGQFDTTAIGGATDIAISSSAGTDLATSVNIGAPDSELSINNDLGVSSTVTLTWDGEEVEAADRLFATGLSGGNLDLTDGGQSDGFVLEVTEVDAENGADLTLSAYDSDGDFFTEDISQAIGRQFIPFSQFESTTLPNTDPGDFFTSVGAVQLSVSTADSVDFGLDVLETGSRQVNTPAAGPLAAAGFAVILATFLVAGRGRLTEQRF